MQSWPRRRGDKWKKTEWDCLFKTLTLHLGVGERGLGCLC